MSNISLANWHSIAKHKVQSKATEIYCRVRQHSHYNQGYWTDSVPSGYNCIPVSAWHGSSIPGWTVSPITASASHRGGLRSATTSNQVIPRCRLSTYGTRAFSVAGPVCWNSLPDYLKSSDLSFNCFRQQLKTFIFCKYWHQSQHYFSTLEMLLMHSTNPWYLLTYKVTYKHSVT